MIGKIPFPAPCEKTWVQCLGCREWILVYDSQLNALLAGCDYKERWFRCDSCEGISWDRRLSGPPDSALGTDIRYHGEGKKT